jgi:hypothetical protein
MKKWLQNELTFLPFVLATGKTKKSYERKINPSTLKYFFINSTTIFGRC